MTQRRITKAQGGITHCYKDGADLFDIVAATAWHIVKAHAFAQANKRTSFYVTELMLQMNGYRLEADLEEILEIWGDIACNALTKDHLALWLRYNSYEM